MYRALSRRFARVTPCPPPAWRRESVLRQRVMRNLPACLRSVIAETVPRWGRAILPERALRRSVSDAERASVAVAGWAHRVRPDVIFACYASAELSALERSVPVVYFSDITAALLTSTYPEYMAQGPGFARACDLLERRAMARADIAVLASDAARESAIDDYGRDPGATFAIPLGANLTPARHRFVTPGTPSRDFLELCIVAAEPRRKRLDMAVAATEQLNRMGFKAVLNSIGPPTPAARRSPVVRTLGTLRLGDPADRREHQETLERSHFTILPSLGEAFGIVACEAAHFGRPAVVSDAGGLPTVVLDGVTGVVLPVAAGADDYARAIAAVTDDRVRYRAMSAAALARARTVLNWNAWAEGVTDLIAVAAGAETAAIAA